MPSFRGVLDALCAHERDETHDHCDHGRRHSEFALMRALMRHADRQLGYGLLALAVEKLWSRQMLAASPGSREVRETPQHTDKRAAWPAAS